MKRFLLLIAGFLPLSLFGQALNQDPYLNYYLGQNLNHASLGSLLGRTYDGIAKIPLAQNLPGSWIYGYSLNHMPLMERSTDASMPFGRSYLSVALPRTGNTGLEFQGSNFGEIDTSIKGKYGIDR